MPKTEAPVLEEEMTEAENKHARYVAAVKKAYRIRYAALAVVTVGAVALAAKLIKNSEDEEQDTEA